MQAFLVSALTTGPETGLGYGFLLPGSIQLPLKSIASFTCTTSVAEVGSVITEHYVNQNQVKTKQGLDQLQDLTNPRMFISEREDGRDIKIREPQRKRDVRKTPSAT